ncbi:MAG: magnesium transporter [Chloroflexi bacterium RBG_16_54_18]|nr:MAG: magnesium transporter [Chloroflexi bacterium RBG_16_54_18]
MVAIYKNTEQGLSMLTEPSTGCWINAINPTVDEVNWLQSLGIPQDYITYPLDVDERPRTERENGELLILLRIPYFEGHSADIPYTTIPLGIILNDRYLVTICKRETDILNEFADGRVKSLATSKRLRFVLRLLLSTAAKYLIYLREINRTVEALEDQLQLSTRNKEVLELLKYQKSLTYFTTALKSNELMLERLQRSQIFKAYPEDEDLLEDVITENQQAIEMTNISSNILSGMMDAFASIISNNLNAVMKFLAAITVVLSLPTMIASFYGMNVDLPLDHLPAAYIYPIAFSLVLAIIVLIVFNRRDWL